MDNTNLDNQFEKFPGDTSEVSGEQIERAAEWEQSMESGVPEFTGETFGTANETNEYYGETTDDSETAESGEEYNQGIADAAALINYGLNAATRELGVETVVQKLKNFDVSGSTDPIKDFFDYLGIDQPEEKKELHSEARAAATGEELFREGPNQPSRNESVIGAFSAIADMKELISEVEGADPRYEDLRQGAKAAGKGVFDYAVSTFGTQDLTKLFQVLASQREQTEAPADDESSEDYEVKN